ncbi:MAG: single-stranded DNA-binding protein [Oscillospiraceae bacterium]|nr:single-stranded DNA-binding protein [Oscillospiraceae bacterium]
MINNNTTLDDLIKIVICTLDDVQSGEEFIIKDLFRGIEWNRIPKGMRTKLGSMILYLSKGKKLSGVIKPVKKTPQNQQIYIKI